MRVGRALTTGIWIAAVAVGSAAEPASGQWPLLGEPSVRIGELDGPQEFIFAWIQDIEVDDRGSVYVLDTQMSRITRYAPDGAFLEEIGRAGQGPGEFREPSDMTIDSSGQLHVVDPGNNRVTFFDVTGNEARYVGEHRLIGFGSDICAAGGRRFVLTFRGDGLIHEIAADGRPLRRFGEPVQPEGELARSLGGREPPGGIFRQGSILCDGASRRILYVTLRTGHVRLYSMAGELIWSRTLDDFRRPEIRVRRNTCCFFSTNPESNTTHRTLGAVLDGDWIRISLYERGPGNGPGAVSRYEMRILRANDGVELWSEASPMIASAVHDGAVIGHRREPFPHVLIW